jgi:hypothetical protein
MTGPLTGKPELLAEYVAGVWIRMLRRNGAVADEVARKMKAGEYGVDDYLQSVTNLVDGALLDGIELATTFLGGPGFNVASNVKRSAPYAVGPYKDRQYQVTITSPLSRGFGDVLPATRLNFESLQANQAETCPAGVLPAGTEQFRLVVDRTNLQSGSYAGKAEVTPLPAAMADAGDKQVMDVSIEL